MPVEFLSDLAEALDPAPLLRFLHDSGVAHIIIGGVAVAAHGYPRPTKDLDVVPDADRGNLTRLAAARAAISAVPAEQGDVSSDEFPMDATDADDLARGGNFRLETDLGPLDVMQWIAGLDADDLYRELARDALAFTLAASRCATAGSLILRAMKAAAGRPRDLDDLEHLAAA